MAPPLFPTLLGLTYPVPKSPIWSTDVQMSVSGKRSTLARYSVPRYAWELPFSFLRSDATNLELQTLMAFYNVVNGRANVFRYNDPTDNSVTANLFGTGDGATKAFQLVRTMTGNGFSWVDPVFYPVTQAIYDNASLVDPANYAIANGLVTFTAAPVAGHSLTWTGTFHWICRFDDDTASFEQFMQTIFELKKIKFSSEKV